jgi:hypothetical protein
MKMQKGEVTSLGCPSREWSDRSPKTCALCASLETTPHCKFRENPAISKIPENFRKFSKISCDDLKFICEERIGGVYLRQIGDELPRKGCECPRLRRHGDPLLAVED